MRVRPMSGIGHSGLEMPDFATIRVWVPLDMIEDYLASADFSYVPYDFSQAHRVFVETSFPNKVSCSMKSGLLILFHGPSCLSVAGFLGDYPAGISADTLDPRGIARRLMATSSTYETNMPVECFRAATEQFDQEAVSIKWVSMIGLLGDHRAVPR